MPMLLPLAGHCHHQQQKQPPPHHATITTPSQMKQNYIYNKSLGEIQNTSLTKSQKHASSF